jgi:hypothetical protein
LDYGCRAGENPRVLNSLRGAPLLAFKTPAAPMYHWSQLVALSEQRRVTIGLAR